jgi:crotonobetainyl-CoA:carnitine CoA-transferase CaiB-like acyl-CoA transferase
LLRRERTGEGATLDITMLEALGEWMGFPAYFAAYGGAAPPRSGAHHATIVPYGPFRAGDGGTVFISVQNEREFARFCEIVLRKTALATDPRFSKGPARLQNRESMQREIDGVFSALKTSEILARLDAADIANARLNSVQEFWDHPQLKARSRWTEVGSAGGSIAALRPPFNIEGMEARMDAVPQVGEHTRAILEELGYSAAEIGRLEREKAI